MPRTRVVTERDSRRATLAGTRALDVTNAVVTQSARDAATRAGVVPKGRPPSGGRRRSPAAARAATPIAANAREHNDANVLTLGGGLIGPWLAPAIVETFLTASFGGGRHAVRVARIDALDGARVRR